MKDSFEENPFEDKVVAAEWINSVENEKGMYRDTEIYPRLERWIAVHPIGTVVEIGAGQGICSEKLGDFKGNYIGIEPSRALVNRANELYKKEGREFLIGNAYRLPIEDFSVDAVFSVMVWFHLEHLDKAAYELARILKANTPFLIITANPNADRVWESFFIDHAHEGKKLQGSVNVPINPLSESVIYQHSLKEIADSFVANGLIVDHVEEFGPVDGEYIFISIEGHKK